jgi:putative SOS response-associated peptidase YedK
MCGRFTLTVSAGKVAEAFGLNNVPAMAPRYNIAPTQPVAVVTSGEQGRQFAMFRWGLIPFWADDPKIGNRLASTGRWRREQASVSSGLQATSVFGGR